MSVVGFPAACFVAIVKAFKKKPMFTKKKSIKTDFSYDN